MLVCFMLLLQNITDWRVNKRNSFPIILEARKSNIMQVWHHIDSEFTGILLHTPCSGTVNDGVVRRVQWCVVTGIPLCCEMLLLERHEQTSAHTW